MVQPFAIEDGEDGKGKAGQVGLRLVLSDNFPPLADTGLRKLSRVGALALNGRKASPQFPFQGKRAWCLPREAVFNAPSPACNHIEGVCCSLAIKPSNVLDNLFTEYQICHLK
jgi:hypothetical protein